MTTAHVIAPYRRRPHVRATATPAAWRNWAGNQQPPPPTVLRPGTVDEVAVGCPDAPADAGRRVKAVGSGHSFTAIAARRRRAPRPVRHVGPGRGGPRREAGHRAGRHAAARAQRRCSPTHGLALPNLGDIDAQTVAGAISTGTHGTGAGVRLPVHVRGRPDPGHRRPARCSAARPTNGRTCFAAARVGLGALGVLTEVTLRCVDAFVLRADERPTPLAEVLADLPSTDRRRTTTSSSTGSRTPTGRRSSATTGCRPTTAPLSRLRGWLDDDFLVQHGLRRRLPARPGGAGDRADDQRGLRPGAQRPRLHRPGRTGSSVRRDGCASSRWSTGCRAPPCRRRSRRCRRIVDGLPFKVQFPVEVRFTGAGRHLALARLRPRVRVRRDPPVHRRAVRAVLPGVRGGLRSRWAGGRTGASCTTATRRRCARRTRGSTTSWRSATRSTRAGSFANAYTEQVLGS